VSGPYLSSSVAGRPLRPATRQSHGGPLPRHLADRPRAHQEAHCCFGFSSTRRMATCGINSPFGELSPTSRQIAHVLRTRAPLNQVCITTNLVPFDLHVLSTPPAFVLSQNQTLRESFSPPAKGGKVPAFILLIRRDCEKTANQELAVKFRFEIDERTHYPAFAECVCAKNVLNFALPAKPESGCQKTTLSGLLDVIRRRRCRLYRQVINANQRGQRPRELLPARLSYRPGLLTYPINKPRQRSF
jgi:hypothetical protein